MHDKPLRVLLESKKTLSRKAKSRPGSALSSGVQTPNSPAAQSRAETEEENRSDSDYADVISLSTESTSDYQATDSEYGPPSSWKDILSLRMNELDDRKRTSVQKREVTLWGYRELLRHHYARDTVSGWIPLVMPAILKSIGVGSSDGERLLALDALSVTLITCPSETAFDRVFNLLQEVCRDVHDEDVKAGAIYALSVAVVYGGGSQSAYEEVLDFFLGIIESDGATINAEDNGIVVAAALETWAFVATQLQDLAAQSEQALDTFTEQLDSTDVRVQVTAGSNIALIFEAARDMEEETGQSLNLQYNQHKIMTRMAEINRNSLKSISRKDRRYLRANFASIVTSLERGKGPGYSTAGRRGFNPHTGGQNVEMESEFREFGYRERIRVHDQVMIIDTWSLRARVEALRTALGGGLVVHLVDNPAVDEMLGDAHLEAISTSRAKDKRKQHRGAESTRNQAQFPSDSD